MQSKHVTMTRMHFELIAEVIQELNLEPAEKELIATQFAKRLRGTNSNFDSGKFIRVATNG